MPSIPGKNIHTIPKATAAAPDTAAILARFLVIVSFKSLPSSKSTEPIENATIPPTIIPKPSKRLPDNNKVIKPRPIKANPEREVNVFKKVKIFSFNPLSLVLKVAAAAKSPAPVTAKAKPIKRLPGTNINNNPNPKAAKPVIDVNDFKKSFILLFVSVSVVFNTTALIFKAAIPPRSKPKPSNGLPITINNKPPPTAAKPANVAKDAKKLNILLFKSLSVLFKVAAVANKAAPPKSKPKPSNGLPAIIKSSPRPTEANPANVVNVTR